MFLWTLGTSINRLGHYTQVLFVRLLKRAVKSPFLKKLVKKKKSKININFITRIRLTRI